MNCGFKPAGADQWGQNLEKVAHLRARPDAGRPGGGDARFVLHAENVDVHAENLVVVIQEIGQILGVIRGNARVSTSRRWSSRTLSFQRAGGLKGTA